MRATFETKLTTDNKSEETMRWVRELFGELMRQIWILPVSSFDATVASLDVWEQVGHQSQTRHRRLLHSSSSSLSKRQAELAEQQRLHLSAVNQLHQHQ